MPLHILTHPLIAHKLTLLRRKETPTADFRRLLEETTLLMGYEVTRDLPLEEVPVETPVGPAAGQRIAGKKLCLVPVLRAGLGMTEGLLKLLPSARVGVIGLYRDPQTLRPVEYYCKLPSVEGRLFLITDPMLATGGSSAAAITLLKQHGARHIRLLCLVAAPEGVSLVEEQHPDVDIYTAALDDHLNGHGYIVPGLGDAGDRIFGTK